MGADVARRAGYDGSRAKIAVLDTGIDAATATSPDGSAPPPTSPVRTRADSVGHGTHVASTAAGPGARSAGTYGRVAPKAGLVVGKLLGEYGGLTSWIEGPVGRTETKVASMPSPDAFTATRSPYDSAVLTYAELFRDSLGDRPLDRAILGPSRRWRA